MGRIDLIVQALLAGAAAAPSGTYTAAAREAYEALSSLLKRRFKNRKKPEGNLILRKVEDNPEVWKPPLRDSLAAIGADRDTEILAAAKNLLDLLKREGAFKGTFTGDFRKAKGPVQIEKIDSFTQIIEAEPRTESGKGTGGKKGADDGAGNGKLDTAHRHYYVTAAGRINNRHISLHRRAESALRSLHSSDQARVYHVLELLLHRPCGPPDDEHALKVTRFKTKGQELYSVRATARLRVLFTYDPAGDVSILDIVSHDAMKRYFSGGET